MILSGELSNRRDSYLLEWSSASFKDILTVNILKRRLPVGFNKFNECILYETTLQNGPIVYAWDTIDLTKEEFSQERDLSGKVVLQNYNVGFHY